MDKWTKHSWSHLLCHCSWCLIGQVGRERQTIVGLLHQFIRGHDDHHHLGHLTGPSGRLLPHWRSGSWDTGLWIGSWTTGMVLQHSYNWYNDEKYFIILVIMIMYSRFDHSRIHHLAISVHSHHSKLAIQICGKYDSGFHHSFWNRIQQCNFACHHRFVGKQEQSWS